MGAQGSLVAVVLAAGEGSRFDGPSHKLLAPFDESTVVGTAIAAALEADIGPLAVVTGAVPLWDVIPPGVVVLSNPSWADGQAGSVQVAVAWAEELGATQLVVGLGDQPRVGPAAWRTVAAGPEAPIAVARFGDVRCPPVRLDRSVWPLLPSVGDGGARTLIRNRPDLVVDVDCEGDPADIDTTEDLARWS